MKRIAVKSSAVRSIGYNEDTQILQVEILGTGEVYEYLGVPFEGYDQFMHAESIGTYYNKVIKEKYDYRKIR